MQFRLVKTGRRYSKSPEDHPVTMQEDVAEEQQRLVIAPIPDDIARVKKESVGPSVVWRGTMDEYLSLLVLREAELVVAKAQLTGNEHIDWYAKNRILDLEIKVADLKKWLVEARAKQSGA